MNYVTVIGNPFRGLKLYGPFDTPDEATDFATDTANHEEWYTLALRDPNVAVEVDPE